VHEVIYGGTPMNGSVAQAAKNPQVISATFGRLLHHIFLKFFQNIPQFFLTLGTYKHLNVNSVKMCLIDEACILQEIIDIKVDMIKIIRMLPKDVQYVITTSSCTPSELQFYQKFMRDVVVVNTL
jgi:superfamily II DNA/RNA helicase